MELQTVLYEKRDGVAYVTLNRPKALNAFDDGLNADLSEAWEDFAADASVGVAIVTGAGRAFSAGADLKSWIPKWEKAHLGSLRENAAMGLGGGITRGRHRLYKPIIAAVNGPAFGGGFELALACDIRLASEKARFGVFEVRMGLHQGDGGLVRLVNIAGMGVALDLTLTGREVLADEALRLRLVTAVVPEEELLPLAERYARMILANSPVALASAKETVMDVVGRPLDDALRLETLNGYSCLGDFTDAKRRIDSFFSKG